MTVIGSQREARIKPDTGLSCERRIPEQFMPLRILYNEHLLSKDRMGAK